MFFIRKRRPCRLLALPAELRNHIYHLALTEDDPILITTSGFAPYESGDAVEWKETHLTNEPSLLHTCRQIRLEALPVFYSGNVFQEDGWEGNPAEHWLTRLSPERRLMLRQLRLEHDVLLTAAQAVRFFEARYRHLNGQGIVLKAGTLFVEVVIGAVRFDSQFEWTNSPAKDGSSMGLNT